MVEPKTAELLRELAQRYHVPGLAFARFDNGQVTTVELGNRQHGRPDEEVGAESRFPLGSVGKMAMATVALQLVEDGDLGLDEPLGDSVPDAGTLAPVTLRQLLSHTSGLPDLPEVELGPHVPLKQHVLAARDVTPVCRPGRFSYSNFGYVVVAYLIETVLGMKWWEAAQSFVFNPLGATCAVPGRGEISQHAVHLPTGAVEVVEPELPTSIVASGTIAMSAGDLLSLAIIHCVPNSVLDSARLKDMRRPETTTRPFGLADSWGLGLALFDGGAWIGHDGYTGGATCAVRVNPSRQEAVVLMTNASSGRWLGDRLLDAIGAGSHRVPDPGEALRGAELRDAAAELTGVYRSGGRIIEVRLDTGDLYFGSSRISLYPDLVFRVDGDDFPDYHRFLREPDTGIVGGLQFGGARVMAKQV